VSREGVTIIVRGGPWTGASMAAALRMQEARCTVILDMAILDTIIVIDACEDRPPPDK
jgi:hypothetical protein